MVLLAFNVVSSLPDIVIHSGDSDDSSFMTGSEVFVDGGMAQV
jgi:hypothetical protein